MILDRTAPENPIVIEEVTDPEEISRARARRGRFDRNWEWLQGRVGQVAEAYRGKSLCVAGQELYVADRAEDAVAQARAAHPDDDGWFVMRVPNERTIRIYVAQR